MLFVYVIYLFILHRRTEYKVLPPPQAFLMFFLSAIGTLGVKKRRERELVTGKERQRRPHDSLRNTFTS